MTRHSSTTTTTKLKGQTDMSTNTSPPETIQSLEAKQRDAGRRGNQKEWHDLEQRLNALRADKKFQAHKAEGEAEEQQRLREVAKRIAWEDVTSALAGDAALAKAAGELQNAAEKIAPLFVVLLAESKRVHGNVVSICQETARNGEVWIGDPADMFADALLQQMSNGGVPIPNKGIDKNARSITETAAVALTRYQGELTVHGRRKGYVT